MFGRRKDQQETGPAGPADDGTEPAADAATGRKGRPTPKRRDQEARNRRPLVPNDRKAAYKASRAEERKQRELTRQAMITGDERHLPVRERGPQKRFVRDMVDARRNVGEIFLPAVFVIMILSLVFPNRAGAPVSPVALASTISLPVLLLLLIVDGVILSRAIGKRAGQRFGADKLERGLRWYGVIRSTQMRFMRMPKPQVNRGQFPWHDAD